MRRPVQMRRVAGPVLSLIVVPLIAGVAQEQPRRPRLAPVPRPCGANITAVRESMVDGQPTVSYDITNDSQPALLRLETVLMVYSRDGLRRTTTSVDAGPQELPLSAGAVLSQTQTVPDLQDDDFVRVGVGAVGSANEACDRRGAERAADAEFDPPKVLVSNPEGSPVTLGTAKLLETATGDPIEVQYVVVNHSKGIAVDRIAALVFEYSPTAGPVIRFQSFGSHRPATMPEGTRLDAIRLSVPKVREGYLWKVVLVPVEVTVDGRTWALESPKEIAEAKATLAAAASGRSRP